MHVCVTYNHTAQINRRPEKRSSLQEIVHSVPSGSSSNSTITCYCIVSFLRTHARIHPPFFRFRVSKIACHLEFELAKLMACKRWRVCCVGAPENSKLPAVCSRPDSVARPTLFFRQCVWIMKRMQSPPYPWWHIKHLSYTFPPVLVYPVQPPNLT